MTLTNSKSKEILLATVTQILLTVKPNFVEGSFKGSLKIEGIILEGSGPDDNLITVVSSEHLKDSPAFVFTSNWEKSNHLKCPYRLQATLNSMECIYVKVRVFWCILGGLNFSFMVCRGVSMSWRGFCKLEKL